MSDAALLVPVDVSAMVVTGRSRNFRRWEMSYEKLQNAASPETDPFGGALDQWTQDPANHGVYLAWTLPDALRRGRQDPATGPVTFPPVPNRWLVVRSHGDPAARQAAAWVVESDYVWPAGYTRGGDTRPEADPARSAASLDPAQPARPARIGRKVPVAAGGWREPGHAGGWLTAVGPGNVSFSAYQPHNPNVFSFHDELALRGVPAGTVSYFVAGWYAQPGDDPLAAWDAEKGPDGLKERLAELGWKVQGDPLPRRIVCHGRAAGVRWEPGADLAPELPAPGRVRMAVGNTSIDALTALVEAQVREAGTARLLEAFQYDLLPVLDQPGGDRQLEVRIRDAWFGSRPAGTRWEAASADPEPGAEPFPPPTAEQLAAEAQLLDPLNAAQAELDAARLELAALQRRLFEVWWKSRAGRSFARTRGTWPQGTSQRELDAALDPAHPASEVAPVRAALDRVAALEARVAALADRAAAGGPGVEQLREGRELKASALPRFWTPADPVVVIAGAKQSGILRPRDTRLCRTADQLVTGLQAALPGGAAATVGADAAARAAPAVNLSGMPPEVGPLLAESVLLDPGAAPALAREGLGGDDEARREAARAAAQAPTATGGILPDLELGAWSPPWLPLFLEWEVRWYPIDFQKDGTPLWSLRGLDYERDGPDVPQPIERVFSGRSILTPKPAFDFRARLRQFAQQYGAAGLERLDELIEESDGWDFLSQTLTGMHEWLALRDPRASVAPDDTPLPGLGLSLPRLLAGGQHSVPQSRQAQKPRFADGTPAPDWEGMRGGQFVFTRVAVVDRFGQTVEVVTTQSSPTFVPLRAPGLTATRPVVPQSAGTVVQLPPRLLQPARLTLDLLSPQGDAPVSLAAAASPLCGWLVANHLDGALAAYAPDGAILGELRVAAARGGNRRVVWEAAPGTDAPATLDGVRAVYAHLGDLLAGLADAGPVELARYLEAVDETLWAVDPLGDRSDQVLNALVGRPLAVVRAAVGLELQGRPVEDPAWPYTFKPKPATFTRYSFAVELGDAESRRDGLMGYYAGGYGRFNTVHPLPDAPADGYLRPIGPENRLSVPVSGPPVPVTLVVDPRGTVSARCGLLPSREVGIPQRYVEGPMRGMQATFRAGPLLTVLRPNAAPPAPPADPRAALRAEPAPLSAPPHPDDPPRPLPWPAPAQRGGAWEWIERDGAVHLLRPLAPLDGRAELADLPASLREGYLRLTGGQAQPPPG